MPERNKQVDSMARTLAGAPFRPFNMRLGTKPEEITDEDWETAQQTADRVYVDLIESIDFQRILIETNKRHLTVHPEKTTLMAAADIGVSTYEAICHECMTEVLLALDTNPPWTEQADSPRYTMYTAPELPLLNTPDDMAAWDDIEFEDESDR